MKKKNGQIKLLYNLKEKIALINENKRVYIIVELSQVAELLTTEDFPGTKLARPINKYTKIIIKNYPLYADPEIFPKNNKAKWIRRIKKFGKETRNLVAGMTGEIPELIADYPEKWTSNQYACEKFEETPIICFKCSKWNLYTAECNRLPKCHFCSENHDSKLCSEKIKNKEIVIRKCANATSISCSYYPKKTPNGGVPKKSLRMMNCKFPNP